MDSPPGSSAGLRRHLLSNQDQLVRWCPWTAMGPDPPGAYWSMVKPACAGHRGRARMLRMSNPC
jgi:hypothetical protein